MADFFSLSQASFREMERLQKALNLALSMFPALWRKALNDAGDIAHKYYDRQFKSEGAEFGTKWKDLAASTQRQRQKKGYKPAHPILVRRGYLRASVASKTSANARRTVTAQGIVMASTLKTKSGLNLLALHQAGGKHLPKRQIYKAGEPPFISQRGWKEIKLRFLGMFIEIRRAMEGA